MKNVAAYCRVSTDEDDQMNSLDNQTSFFYEYIQHNPEWHFVNVYSDEGVSGTSVSKRTSFNQMISDAKSGMIDLIITKEVSRFARNTVDTLSYTRELRGIGVGVIFINDNINTLDSDGEFRLSIMASVAQEESRKTSSRVKWGMKRQMEKGFTFSPPMLGYDSAGGVLTVNEAEAEIVRHIFDLYVHHNMGTIMIAKTLAAENTPTTKRIKCWSSTAVMRILSNEKYVGDLVSQKTTVVDFLTHKSVVNTGEKLYFKDHHEPIIDRATWDEAQRIHRARSLNMVAPNKASHSNKYWCSGKVECGVCHGTFVTRTKQARYGRIRQYRCKHTKYYESGGGGCTNTTYIDERILKECMRYVFTRLDVDREYLRGCIASLMRSCGGVDEYAKQIADIEKKIAGLNDRKKKAMALLLDDTITKDEYRIAANDIDREILELSKKRNEVQSMSASLTQLDKQIEKVLACVDQYLDQVKPTSEIYSEILDHIVVYNDNHVDVFVVGVPSPFSVGYQRSGRGTQYTVSCFDYSTKQPGYIYT